MPFENVRALSYIADGAIPKNRFVVSADNGQVALAGANAEAIGVSLDTGVAGQVLPVAAMDGAKVEVEAGAAIDVSSTAQDVTSDATGRAVVAATGNRVLGFAVSSAGAAGQFLTVVLTKGALAAP